MEKKLSKKKYSSNGTLNSSIKAISICVPNEEIDNTSDKKITDVTNFIGVKKKFFDKSLELKTSDLCVEAAKVIIKKNKINKNDINFIIFVSQTRDYLMPSTSCIIQDKLGLKKEMICLDVPYGCSGYIYGLYISLLIANNIKKSGLLLSGDMSSKFIDHNDKKMMSLFGDAGSATYIKFENKKKFKSLFKFGTDGSGFKSLLLNNDGFSENKTKLLMNGPKIFEFAIKEVPKQFGEILEENNIKIDDIDYFIFHQANKFILETLQKKLKIPSRKMLYSIEKFGNTNSASIPVTISSNKINFNKKTILMCGFGIGLSWSTAIINTNERFFTEFIKYGKK